MQAKVNVFPFIRIIVTFFLPHELRQPLSLPMQRAMLGTNKKILTQSDKPKKSAYFALKAEYDIQPQHTHQLWLVIKILGW